MPALIKSQTELSREDLIKAAARAQSKLQCADRYIGAILASSDFATLRDRNACPSEIATFAIETAEALLSTWEATKHPVEGSDS